MRQRTLRADVLVLHQKAVDVVGVDVVATPLTGYGPQRYQRVVVCTCREQGAVSDRLHVQGAGGRQS